MLVLSSTPSLGFVPSNPLLLPTRRFGADSIARSKPGRLQHSHIVQPGLRNGRRSLVMCYTPEKRKSPLALRKKFTSLQPRVRGKRISSFLRFMLMGPLFFFLWRLKPQIASANPFSPVAAATSVGSGMLEPTDVASILQEAMHSFGMNPANPEWMKLASTYIINM